MLCYRSSPGKEQGLWAAEACHAETANLFFVLLLCTCRKLLWTCARQTKAGERKPAAQLKDQHTLHPQIRTKLYVSGWSWQPPLRPDCGTLQIKTTETELQAGHSHLSRAHPGHHTLCSLKYLKQFDRRDCEVTAPPKQHHGHLRHFSFSHPALLEHFSRGLYTIQESPTAFFGIKNEKNTSFSPFLISQTCKH